MFLKNQPSQQVEDYKQLLRISGSLSKLFSENKTPYLNYRLAENVFCKAFEASNESRSDVSVDAVKGKVGIGLKTFLYKPSQVEKIAEFNKELALYAGLPDLDIAKKISQSRNTRIDATISLYELTDLIYHCVARNNGKFIIYEVPMDRVTLNSVTKVGVSKNSISFSDGINQYSFNKSKSTLFKKFIPPKTLTEFDVEIIEDPYKVLLEVWDNYGVDLSMPATSSDPDFIVLPLFSTNGDGSNYVPEGSGLNQWNAKGRPRDADEVYIRIPSWIHTVFPGFLPPRDEQFELILPNKRPLTAKVCQQNSKALMSNPNKDLGEWLLRQVFHLGERKLLTYERMLLSGIDSVALYKNTDGTFEISMKEVGTFDKFEEDYKNS